MVQHIKHNTLVIEINSWLFAPTQINRSDSSNDNSVIINFVPCRIIEELYKPPFNHDPEVIVE